MTPEEFVIWFKGFATAANPYNITPKQWDDIKEQLEKVNQNIVWNGPTTADRNHKL